MKPDKLCHNLNNLQKNKNNKIYINYNNLINKKNLTYIK